MCRQTVTKLCGQTNTPRAPGLWEPRLRGQTVTAKLCRQTLWLWEVPSVRLRTRTSRPDPTPTFDSFHVPFYANLKGLTHGEALLLNFREHQRRVSGRARERQDAHRASRVAGVTDPGSNRGAAPSCSGLELQRHDVPSRPRDAQRYQVGSAQHKPEFPENASLRAESAERGAETAVAPRAFGERAADVLLRHAKEVGITRRAHFTRLWVREKGLCLPDYNTI